MINLLRIYENNKIFLPFYILDKKEFITSEKRTKSNVNLCILCQKEKRSEKTSSNANGRTKSIVAINDLKDDYLVNLSEYDLNNIKYHLKDCYKPYILKADRSAKRKQEEGNDTENCGNETLHSNIITTPRLIRRKSDAVVDNQLQTSDGGVEIADRIALVRESLEVTKRFKSRCV